MLFLVISDPRPERPSAMTAPRKRFWRWLGPKLKSRQCVAVWPRVGRGAVAVLDVKSHEELHALLNEWAEIIPARFTTFPLIDIRSAKRYLDGSAKGRRRTR